MCSAKARETYNKTVQIQQIEIQPVDSNARKVQKYKYVLSGRRRRGGE
jgi:hypothetical protein